MSDDASPSLMVAASRRERALWLAVAVAGAAALVVTLTPGVVGFFHDDAIYTSGAMSVVQGEGYRLLSLPDAPFQTKYPPLFSYVLALVWWLRPDFPSNVLLLKAVNLAFLGVAALATAFMARAQNPRGSWLIPLFCQVALLTNPEMVGLANFTMSDVFFAALVAVVLLLRGQGDAPVSWRTDVVIAGLVAASILTRSVGVALGAAVVFECLRRGERPRALMHAVVAGGVAGTWMTWAWMHRDVGSALIEYYQTYERPAFSYLTTDPALAFSIVEGNLRLIPNATPLLVGPLWTVLWPGLVVILVAGAWQLAQTGWRLPLLFAGCHLALVLVHPWWPDRYLLPLVPTLILAVGAGATYLWSLVRRAPANQRRPTSLPALVALMILVFGNFISLNFRLQPSATVKAWDTADSGYEWSGFEETFAWVRSNTPADAKLGSLFDTMYFLYTGRPAVRPWFHRSETYFYPVGAAQPFVGRSEDVLRELRALGIDYIVLDPPKGRFEGKVAMKTLRTVMAMPEVNGRLVFTSADGLHEIYSLWNPPGRIDGAPSRTP